MAQSADNHDDNKQEEKGIAQVYQEQYLECRDNYRSVWNKIKEAQAILIYHKQKVAETEQTLFQLTQQLAQASINKSQSEKTREKFKLKSLMSGNYAVEVHATPGGPDAYQEELNRTTREYLAIAQAKNEPPKTHYVRKIVQPIPYSLQPAVYDYALVCVIVYLSALK